MCRPACLPFYLPACTVLWTDGMVERNSLVHLDSGESAFRVEGLGAREMLVLWVYVRVRGCNPVDLECARAG